MVTKSSAQVTLIDITDGYTVGQTTESWVIPAVTTSGSTTAVANESIAFDVYSYRGSQRVSNSVTSANISSVTGITPSVTYNSTTVGGATISSAHIELTTGSNLSGSGIITIPVTVTHVDNQAMTFNCQLSYTVARTGETGQTGADGADGADGEDAIVLSITANPGTIIKNSSSDVVLTAHVYKGGIELSSSTTPTLASQGTIRWYKGTSTKYIVNSGADSSSEIIGGHTVNTNNNTLTVTAAAIQSIGAYTAKLIS